TSFWQFFLAWWVLCRPGFQKIWKIFKYISVYFSTGEKSPFGKGNRWRKIAVWFLHKTADRKNKSSNSGVFRAAGKSERSSSRMLPSRITHHERAEHHFSACSWRYFFLFRPAAGSYPYWIPLILIQIPTLKS